MGSKASARTPARSFARVEVRAPDRDSAERLPAEDWAETWKAGLRAIDVSPRLRIRPSFAEPSPPRGQGRESGRAARRSRAKGGPPLGQAELVIDPGQAFGTGSHASTRLALEWIDRLAPRLPPGSPVPDLPRPPR